MEVKAGGSETQSHPQLCSKFKANVGYMSSSFKNEHVFDHHMLIVEVFKMQGTLTIIKLL